MAAAWLPIADTLLALGALLGVFRLHRAHRRHQREVQVKLATLAHLLERANRSAPPAVLDLTAEERRALARLKRGHARNAGQGDAPSH